MGKLFYLELYNEYKLLVIAEGLLEAWEIVYYYERKYKSKKKYLFEISKKEIDELIPIQ